MHAPITRRTRWDYVVGLTEPITTAETRAFGMSLAEFQVESSEADGFSLGQGVSIIAFIYEDEHIFSFNVIEFVCCYGVSSRKVIWKSGQQRGTGKQAL